LIFHKNRSDRSNNLFQYIQSLKGFEKVTAPSTIDNFRFGDVDTRRRSKIKPISKKRFGGYPLCSSHNQ